MKAQGINRRFNVLLAAAITALLGIASATADQERSDLSSGQVAPSFQAKTTDGKTVKFPDDYRGKVVLIDFWATWCPPCRAEIPNVVAAYGKYHAKGFEVLGISLDRPRQGPELIKFTQDHQMPWPQVYDGQYWKAAVALQYGVHAIPCPVVADGDTGKILAIGSEAIGSRLPRVIEKALAAKPK